MSYLPRFIPSLLLSTLVELQPEKKPAPSLKYILIYNRNLVDKKAESDEALSQQILCFEARNDIKMDLAQQLNVLGLCQGAFALCNELSPQLGPTGDRFIKTGHSVLVVANLEPNFHMILCVDLDETLSALVARQVCHASRHFHSLYLLLHPQMTTQLLKQGRDHLEGTLSSYWSAFLGFFNSHSGLNPLFPWSNLALFKGFLSTFAYYKRSSINVGAALENELDAVLEPTMSGVAPLGVLAALTGQEESGGLHNIKNSGVLHSSGLQNMTKVYQLLEWYEWNGFLKEGLIPCNIFATKEGSFKDIDGSERVDLEDNNSGANSATNSELAEPVAAGIEAETTQGLQDATTDTSFDSREFSTMFKNTAFSTLEALHPASLTRNLVVLPLNTTVQGVRNFGETAQGWLSNPFTSEPQSLTLLVPVQQSTNHSVETSEDEQGGVEEGGFFVIGEMDDEISRKNVYLDDKEYALVVYKHGPVVISLLYDSNSKQLDQPEFYQDLARNILQPAVEEIALQVSTRIITADPNIAAGGMVSSIGSLKTLNTILSDQPDFFFVVIDPKEGTMRSSLPYLVGDSINGHRNAVFYLHDMLLDVFVTQGSAGFFEAEAKESTIAEFYHKFTGEKGSDWMVYYFRYHGKYIVVIRNHSIAKKRKKSTVPSSVSAEASGRGIFNTIADGVSDYTRLGFVENLGEDVREWLEGFSASGAT